MNAIHPGPAAHLRLFLTLSALGHLLVFVWSTPLLPFAGHTDSALSVTLEAYRFESTQPAAQRKAMRPPATALRDIGSDAHRAISGTALPATYAMQESPATASENSNDGTEMLSRVRSHLLASLANHFHYPARARRNGWEGTVLLGLRVEPDGLLDEIRLVRSSGYAVLDNSALNSLKRIGHVVEARSWLNGRHVDLQLPVIYRLIEN